MTAVTDAAALLAWMDDAHAAVEYGHVLSPVMLLALVATPQQPAVRTADLTTAARTWFLEEYERMMKTQLRDPVPFAGTDDDIARWRERQALRSADLAGLLHQHSECLVAARAFAAGRPRVGLTAAKNVRLGGGKGKGKPARRTAASVALDAIGEAA